jgi:hypothetical protein
MQSPMQSPSHRLLDKESGPLNKVGLCNFFLLYT